MGCVLIRFQGLIAGFIPYFVGCLDIICLLGTFVNSSCDLVVLVKEFTIGQCFVLACTDIVFYVACKAVILLLRILRSKFKKFVEFLLFFIHFNFLSPYFLNLYI